ncbi:MAG: hypothetical protein ACJ716_05735 [Marmoricola sp.]
MTTTMEPCVSLTTGTLGPDLRVNYAYGMVLGLDEFLQEQLHNLSKDYLHERALHGYGTLSGLHVQTAKVADADDYTVSVTTGIGVDQWGREIVIRCDQCLRLSAWLAAQEQAQPGIIAHHLDGGPPVKPTLRAKPGIKKVAAGRDVRPVDEAPIGENGTLTVYVVAKYAECTDNLVPLPGQPCSSSDQTMVPSRIRDAWDVELVWERPKMPRWDSDRRLARLLGSVQVVAGLPEADSDEAAISTAVLGLADLADDGPADLDPAGPTAGGAWKLPAETAAAALDRIFTVWVTQVRPGLVPDLIDPEADSDPDILLSTITFTPVSPFDPAAPRIASCEDPDDEGRPYLLATELIQELRWLSGGGDAPTPPAVVAKPPISLVTMAASSDAAGLTTIDAWFHAGTGVRLPKTVPVTAEDGNTADFLTRAIDPDGSGFAEVWKLISPDAGIMAEDGLQVSVLFAATELLVGDAATTLANLEAPGAAPWLDQDATGDVTAYAEVQRTPLTVEQPPATEEPPQRETVPFVTITNTYNSDGQLSIELWFHIEPRRERDDAVAVRPAIKLFDDTNGQELGININGPAPYDENVWSVILEDPAAAGREHPAYLRWLFLTEDFVIKSAQDGEISLADWIEKSDFRYLGEDRNDRLIVDFSRAVVVGRKIQSPDGDVHVEPAQPFFPMETPIREVITRKAPTRKAPTRKAPARKAGGNR